MMSDGRLHKTRFCKKKGGPTKTFLIKRGLEQKGELEPFCILRGGGAGGLAKKRGVNFLRGVHTLVLTMEYRNTDYQFSCTL